MDIFETRGLGSRGSGTARRMGLYELQKEVERQRLLIEVLIRSLIEKGLYTRDQLNAMANLIDMEDGVRDGRIKPKPGVKYCANCGRVRMNVSGRCLYCEHEEVMEIV